MCRISRLYKSPEEKALQRCSTRPKSELRNMMVYEGAIIDRAVAEPRRRRPALLLENPRVPMCRISSLYKSPEEKALQRCSTRPKSELRNMMVYEGAIIDRAVAEPRRRRPAFLMENPRVPMCRISSLYKSPEEKALQRCSTRPKSELRNMMVYEGAIIDRAVAEPRRRRPAFLLENPRVPMCRISSATM